MQIIVKKWKCLNWDQKSPYLGIFGLEFLKNIVIFEISNQYLIHTMKFGIRSVFSKGPGPGPGPIYAKYASNSRYDNREMFYKKIFSWNLGKSVKVKN